MYGKSVVKVHYFPFSGMYSQDKSSRMCYYNRQGCSLLAPASECEWSVARAALFLKCQPTLPQGGGSEGSRHLDILLNLLIKSFRMQKCGKQYFPRKSGLTGPLFHALYEQKILTKLLDDTAAASIVGDVDGPAASLGVDNRIDTAEAERDICASLPAKTGNKAAVAAVAGQIYGMAYE